MTAPAPADRLREAAGVVRKLSAAATPGPWRTHDTHLGALGGHTAAVLSGEFPNGELRAWLPTMCSEPWDEARNVWADAAWIALMSPAVGEALAAWLERAAHSHEATLIAAGKTWASVMDPRAVAFVEHMTNTEALATADVILAAVSR